MRLKELKKELNKIEGNPIVTFAESGIMGGIVFLKEQADLYLGSLGLEDSPVGKYVKGYKDSKGDYLIIDLTTSDFFSQDDFQK